MCSTFQCLGRVFRKWMALAVLLLFTFVSLAIWLDPTRVVWGWLRGEAFYQGRPTSWWKTKLQDWHQSTESGILLDFPDGNGVLILRKPTILERAFPTV